MNNNLSLWLTTYNWLTACGNQIDDKYCKEEITSHPDYPSLISVIDFLNIGGMKYKAVQADASFINSFNYPLLAHIRQPGQEYMQLISDSTVWGTDKNITQNWTGVVVYPENNAIWQNEQNDSSRKNTLKNKTTSYSLIFIGLVLLIISGFQFQDIFLIIFGFLSFIGLIISFLLLKTELGFQSDIVKQVCGVIKNGGCEKVLKSRYGNGIFGITPADFSVLYFTAQYSVYIFGMLFPSFLISIFIFSISGIFISIWSLYTQTLKLKQFCALCLGIVIVLIGQSVIAFYLFNYTNTLLLKNGSLYPFFIFSLLILLFLIILLPIKKLIKTNSINKLRLIELKKWKSDADLFIDQWKQEKAVDITIWENDLIIGNHTAPLLITVACNPYCGPCAKAHIQLDKLIHEFSDIVKVQVRLLGNPQNESDRRTIAIRAILQMGSTLMNNAELQQMLTDWFDWMDYTKWRVKWETKNEIDISLRELQHANWIANSSIEFTPTFFINGRKLPNRYGLEDLKLLIPQLSENSEMTYSNNFHQEL